MIHVQSLDSLVADGCLTRCGDAQVRGFTLRARARARGLKVVRQEV
jgi:hypothetical protein